jgi:hypothetical protein
VLPDYKPRIPLTQKVKQYLSFLVTMIEVSAGKDWRIDTFLDKDLAG